MSQPDGEIQPPPLIEQFYFSPRELQDVKTHLMYLSGLIERNRSQMTEGARRNALLRVTSVVNLLRILEDPTAG